MNNIKSQHARWLTGGTLEEQEYLQEVWQICMIDYQIKAKKQYFPVPPPIPAGLCQPKQVRQYANNLFRIPYDIQYKIDVINNNIKYIELQIF